MTLKTETVSPTKPDWYTFQPARTSGLFMEIFAVSVAPRGSRTATSDSYAIAMSVPG